MTLKNINYNELNEVYNLVQSVIRICYSKYYATGVVEFFCKYHSMENLTEDVNGGRVYGLYVDGTLIGTGTVYENHITRVFVKPSEQQKGYGSYIFDMFEKKIFDTFDSVVIDASLAAVKMYDKRGYKTICHEGIDCENGSLLVYDVMEKKR